MSKLGSYKNTAFSESQKFLVLDPSTSSASLVLASELVAYITPSINSVKAESTRLSAENTDYKVGELVQTSGATAIGDGLASVYLVVAGGSGDFPMLNGNDLLVIAGDDALREQLISEVAGQGASLVSMEGGPTVENAITTANAEILKRVIWFTSLVNLNAYATPVVDQAAVVSDLTSDSGIYVYSGSVWVRKLPYLRTNEPAVINQSDLAAFNGPEYTSATSPENGKYWEFTATTPGLENTPDTIKMADARFANRIGGFKAQRLGVFSTPDSLGHRCGTFTYLKTSQTSAELLTDLSRYKAYTIEDVDRTDLTVAYADWRKVNDNSGDGLTWANAKASLAQAIALGTDIVLVRSGFYNRVNRIQDFSVTKDFSIIAVGGPVYAGVLSTGTWSKTAGQTNVYQLDFASGLTNITNRVFDNAIRSLNDAPTVYATVASIAAVDALPGSFYHTGTTTYVHAVNSRDLIIHGDELRLTQPVAVAAITFTGNHKLYFENIHIWGGNGGATILKSNGSAYPGSVFYNKGCVFSGVPDGAENGLAIRDIGICISDGSEASVNRRDGFSYHAWLAGASGVDGLNPHFVEVDCQAHGNGEGGSEGNNQGSTAHEDCVGVRVNGDYSGHQDGGCIVDIEAARVFHAGITANNSNTGGMILAAEGFGPLVGEWWVDGATMRGNPAVAVQQGDLVTQGYKAYLHYEDCVTEKPLSSRTFSPVPDSDFS
jgi:hypothetical protein